MDKWDGYPAERRALLEHLVAARTSNPVVLTGDIHSSWVNDVLRDFEDTRSEVLATELVCTSLTSGGDGSPMTAAGERALRRNPHVRYYNGQRGYVVSTVTPERWTAEYRVVPVVTEPGAGVETAATFVIESGRAGAQQS